MPVRRIAALKFNMFIIEADKTSYRVHYSLLFSRFYFVFYGFCKLKLTLASIFSFIRARNSTKDSLHTVEDILWAILVT